MTMDIPRFDRWCSKAVRLIRHPRDRKRVFRELREHMEDHYDDAMASGLIHWRAVEDTLEAMGDPEELAPVLARIHRPHWSYALDLVRAAAISLLVWALLLLIPTRQPEPAFQPDAELWFTTSADSYGRLRTMLVSPDVSITDGDFTLTVTDAANWVTHIGGYPRQDAHALCFRLELRHPEADPPWGLYLPGRFWALDSLGNRYSPDQIDVWTEAAADPHVQKWFFRIEDHDSQEALWIELRYDQGGRDHVLRIDLTGGGVL